MTYSKKLPVCFAVLLCAQIAGAGSGLSATRTQLIQNSKDLIEKQFPAVVPLNELGDWRDAIENSLYIVLRKTDITRGAVSIRVADTGRFVLFMDSGGIFVISTGVLDFIDDTLFSLIGTSSRRIKNMTKERENLLIPLAAIAAAHYTLDHQYTNYMSAVLSGTTATARREAVPVFTDNQNFEADRFACILLAAAGYDRNGIQQILQILESTATPDKSSAYTTWDLTGYLKNVPPAAKRITELVRMSGGIETVAGEITLAATNIKKGIGLKDSIETLRAIQQVYPTAVCIERFIAQGMHKQWLMAHPQNDGLQPLYTIGTYEISEAQIKPPVIPDSHYRETSDFYRKLLEKQDDPYIAADYAFFMALSPDAETQKDAAATAENAAWAEVYDGTISRRANFASVLYMTGNKQRAVLIMKQLLYPQESPDPDGKPHAAAVPGSRLYAGYTGRLSDAEKNYRIMTANGQKPVPDPDIQTGGYPIRLRNMKINDTVDALITQWGKPAEILYDFYTELWIYTALNARITISDGAITRIEIGTPSPVSLPGEIRTGDRREDFENRNGKAVSRAYDYEIYKIGGQRLYIEYLSGKIRNIILCR